MHLSLNGKDGQIYGDAIEVEIEVAVAVDFRRKPGHLSGYLVGAFSKRILLLILGGLFLRVD